MRIKISHKTIYAYENGAKQAIQIVHLTPRSHEGQFIVNWRIDVDHNCRLTEFEDSLGNIVHSFSVDGPLDRLIIHVEGEVETRDTGGIVAGAVERMPPAFYLRPTELTQTGRKIAAFADKIRARADATTLAILHALIGAIYKKLRFDTASTDATTRAEEAFAQGHGVCQDFAHVFIAAARHLGVPARYVGGYLCRSDGIEAQEAGHAWAEAYVPDLGWVAFDPAHGLCATDAYVRVAIGLDYLGAAPVRGIRYGGAGETMAVEVKVSQAARQAQN